MVSSSVWENVSKTSSSSTTVSYGLEFGSQDLMLLEADETLLREVLHNGVTIVGNPDDEAVLCTSNATYAIKFVSTSNTVLVIPPVDQCPNGNDGDNTPNMGAVATVQGHIELSHISPRLEKLKELLSQRPYREDGDEEEDEEVDNPFGLYSWEELKERVQASENELKEGLTALAALQIGEHWRIVDEKLMQGLLEMIILNATQHDWPLNALHAHQVVPTLNRDGYSSRIVQHCLDTYGTRFNSESEEVMWALSETRVSLHYAKQLLSASSKWKLDDFLEAWQHNLPSGINCNLELLRGEAIVEKLGSESWLRPFSISSLPSKPDERFAALFRERRRWEWPDLEPYVRDLQSPSQSVEALLMKYTRRTQATADAVPVFSIR